MFSSLAVPAQKSLECADSRHVGLRVAGWECRLSVNTDAGLRRLQTLFQPYLHEAPFRGESGLRFVFDDQNRPHMQIVSRGEPLDLRELLKAPEHKTFVPIPGSPPHLYAWEPFGDGPMLEVRHDRAAVLQPQHWLGIAQMALMMLLLHERPIVCLHAAVSAVDGHALVLIGPSGSGKSTLSWALHQQGADYYGDEWTFFTLPEFHQHVWRRDLCLRPGGVDLLDAPPSETNWFQAKPDDPKCAAPLREPGRPCPRESASFIFMDGFAEKPSLKPMPGGPAVQRLLQGMGYGDPAMAARLDVAADLVNHFPCRRLSVGRPEETAALLIEYARKQSSHGE